MRDELLGYYERELTFLRQMGAEFALKYPKIASRLSLEPDKCEDPHVERLLEGFAFLAGRVRLKLDDEFPEITESFLNVLYPHYLAPIPSMSIAQFAFDPTQGKMTAGYALKQGTVLYSRPIQGTPCRFRTCYPVTLWPIEITGATLESPNPPDSRGRWPTAQIKLSLHCLNNTALADLKLIEGKESRPISSLRFYLNGEAPLIYPLYEMIFNNCDGVELRAVNVAASRKQAGAKPPAPIMLSADTIKPVGFEPTEGLLPYTARSFIGYRLLTEYFAFPEKFLFFDLTGIDRAVANGFGDRFEIVLRLRNITPPNAVVDSSTFQLGCAPIINLFNKIAEPIRLTQQQHEYHVIPDVHRQMATEIYSIDAVTSVDPYLQATRHFLPFYSLRHVYQDEMTNSFWYTTRRASERKDDTGTEVFLSLVDLNFDPSVPAEDTITAHITCTNRDLPGRLPFGNSEGDFEVEGAATLSRVRCLRKPTNTLRPPMRRGAHWRLISHLTLNHLSIVAGQADGQPDALREILQLYDLIDSAATRKQIMGIERISSRRVVKQTGQRVGTGFVRGIETTIEFDEDQFVGSGLFLFAMVLERFLGLYASMNSFNQLIARSKQREGAIKQWPPRAGQQILQ